MIVKMNVVQNAPEIPNQKSATHVPYGTQYEIRVVRTAKNPNTILRL